MADRPTYTNQRIALLTQHGKQQVIAPVLEPALGCVIEHVTGFDTDQLGTFTRDTPRLGSQIEAARRKARMGMELSGRTAGVASEGSFGVDPFTGMVPWNVELLVWLDAELGIEVVGMAQGTARSGHIHSGQWHEIEAFAQREDFPHHQLVLRPESQDDSRIQKGIADWTQLRTCFDECRRQAADGTVFVETDLRAFANPTRMRNIEKAARDLLQRLQSYCPDCDKPGYWVAKRLPGLSCSSCGGLTTDWRAEVWICSSCQCRHEKAREASSLADPKYCVNCNP